MTAPISVLNAEVSTVAIEIKTLTIGRKQVTLAVFRQLQEEDLVDWQSQLQGLPWGTVNYHPDASCKTMPGTDSRHMHVVWQKGDELRRAVVWHAWPGAWVQEDGEQSVFRDIVTNHLNPWLLTCMALGEASPPCKVMHDGYGINLVTLTVDGLEFRGDFHDSSVTGIVWDYTLQYWLGRKTTDDWNKKQAADTFRKTHQCAPSRAIRDQLHKQALSAVAEYRQAVAGGKLQRAAWDRRYVELEAELPQLFIAV